MVILVKNTVRSMKLKKKHKAQSTKLGESKPWERGPGLQCKGLGPLTWTIFRHSLLCQMLYPPSPQLYMSLNSVKCMNCHLTPHKVASLCVHLICLVHSRTKFQAHPKCTQKTRFYKPQTQVCLQCKLY